MAKIQFQEKNFRKSSLDQIDKANTIIEEYQAMGEPMTIRQLYYQFVARGHFGNSIKNYDNLQSLMSEARIGGLVDWEAIEDRTRDLVENSHWENPSGIISTVVRAYKLDRWADQDYRVEVWVEKAALAGVMERVCRELDCPFFACRGYTSQSEMYVAGVRLREYAEADQTPVILHFGDHDPSGIDMSRDIEDRLRMYMENESGRLEFERVALTMEQINQYKPPPFPAKVADARYESYRRKYGDDSWELDSLAPPVLSGLIRTNVARYVNKKKLKAVETREATDKELLEKASDNWDDVADFLTHL